MSVSRQECIALRDTLLPYGVCEQMPRREVKDGIFIYRDVYTSPQGSGYIDGVEYTHKGRRHINERHYGPEAHRDRWNNVWK